MLNVDRSPGARVRSHAEPAQPGSEPAAAPRSTRSVDGHLAGLTPRQASHLRNQVYGMRKERFTAALNSNSVGRELAADPHVLHTRLIHDPEQPAIYQAHPDNRFEGSINLRSLDSFASPAEHHATFTHEALHKQHQVHDPDAFRRRQAASGTHPGWSNAEEQLTISGRDPSDPSAQESPLSENRARRELDLRERHSHLPASEDPPRDMTHEEYREWRGQSGGSAVPFDNALQPARRRMPASLARRLGRQEQQS